MSELSPLPISQQTLPILASGDATMKTGRSQKQRLEQFRKGPRCWRRACILTYFWREPNRARSRAITGPVKPTSVGPCSKVKGFGRRWKEGKGESLLQDEEDGAVFMSALSPNP